MYLILKYFSTQNNMKWKHIYMLEIGHVILLRNNFKCNLTAGLHMIRELKYVFFQNVLNERYDY